MTELEFEKLLTSAVKIYNADKEKAMKASNQHEFSPEFERKMDILMGKSNKQFRIKPKRLFIALTAAISVVIIIAMRVNSVREVFINFFNVFDVFWYLY